MTIRANLARTFARSTIADALAAAHLNPRNDPTRQITHADCAEMAGGFNVFHGQPNSAQEAQDHVA